MSDIGPELKPTLPPHNTSQPVDTQPKSTIEKTTAETLTPREKVIRNLLTPDQNTMYHRYHSGEEDESVGWDYNMKPGAVSALYRRVNDILKRVDINKPPVIIPPGRSWAIDAEGTIWTPYAEVAQRFGLTTGKARRLLKGYVSGGMLNENRGYHGTERTVAIPLNQSLKILIEKGYKPVATSLSGKKDEPQSPAEPKEDLAKMAA